MQACTLQVPIIRVHHGSKEDKKDTKIKKLLLEKQKLLPCDSANFRVAHQYIDCLI